MHRKQNNCSYLKQAQNTCWYETYQLIYWLKTNDVDWIVWWTEWLVNHFIVYLEIAMALNFLYPSDTALTIAVLSAHIDSPYEAFSTLQPVKIKHMICLNSCIYIVYQSRQKHILNTMEQVTSLFLFFIFQTLQDHLYPVFWSMFTCSQLLNVQCNGLK